MIKLSPNTRFSYYITKGTMSSRIKRTEGLNNKVFQRLLQLYDRKNACGIGVIKNSYNAILPEKKNIQIHALSLKDCDLYGGGTRVEGSEKYLTGYSIEIPTNKKKKLNILELSSFMHESTHVLDYLFNPKYVANYKQMCEKNIYDKKYFSIYEKYFYNSDEMAKNDKKEMLILAENETKKALKKIPYNEKLIFLNFIKYSMEMEYHAYNQDVKYARILKSLEKPVDEESLEDYNKYMAFPEKIKIINKLLKEELESKRAE